MKTLKGWTGNFSKYVNAGDQVDHGIYWHFFEVLPPIYMSGGFMYSEPTDTNDKGEVTYGAFYCIGDDNDQNAKFYFLGDIAKSEWDSAVEKMKIKHGILKEIHAYKNTSSSAGSPTRYVVNPSEIARIKVWFDVNGDPSYGFIMCNGDTYLLINDYATMKGIIHLPCHRVTRKKDLV